MSTDYQSNSLMFLFCCKYYFNIRLNTLNYILIDKKLIFFLWLYRVIGAASTRKRTTTTATSTRTVTSTTVTTAASRKSRGRMATAPAAASSTRTATPRRGRTSNWGPGRRRPSPDSPPENKMGGQKSVSNNSSCYTII